MVPQWGHYVTNCESLLNFHLPRSVVEWQRPHEKSRVVLHARKHRIFPIRMLRKNAAHQTMKPFK
jgi:hypothetical protein